MTCAEEAAANKNPVAKLWPSDLRGTEDWSARSERPVNGVNLILFCEPSPIASD
jgi:hypothetical protein